MKHGCCSNELVLMHNEDESVFHQKVANYKRDLHAQGEAEADVTAVAAMEFFRIKRSERSDTAAETKHAEGVEDRYDDEKALAVHSLVERFPADPCATLVQLLGMVQGLDWVREQIDELDQFLQDHTALHDSQRALALVLMGRSGRELFVDPAVMAWNMNTLSCFPGARALSAAEVAALFSQDRPETMSPAEFQRWLGDELDLLVSPDEGRAALRETLAAFRDKLLRRRRELVDRQARDKSE
jgi:hypothetical protein